MYSDHKVLKRLSRSRSHEPPLHTFLASIDAFVFSFHLTCRTQQPGEAMSPKVARATSIKRANGRNGVNGEAH
jgi:hypothetical protein